MNKSFLKIFLLCFLLMVIPGVPVSAEEANHVPVKVPQQVTVEAESSRSARLTWMKAEGADFYQIFRSSSEAGAFRKVKEISSTGLERYTYSDNDLRLGRQYYYKIRAGKRQNGSVTYSEYSSVRKIKITLGTPEVKKAASSGYKSIRISWEKTDGADGYQIYRSLSENGSYTLVKTVKRGSELTYAESSLKTGRNYYYKLRAYCRESGKKYVSPYTQVLVIRPVPSTPKITVKPYDYYKTRISWKAVAGADGYYIYRSDSARGTYQRVKTISDSNKLYWVNTGLKRNQSYFYKVSAYKKVGSEKVESYLSSARSGSGKALYQGIDVSAHNGMIDWGQVKAAGVDFAMLRIMQGGISSMKVDSSFEENYQGASDAGIKVGVYRYSYASTEKQAEKEAKKVLKILDGRRLDYPVVLDMEDTVQASLTKEKRMRIIWKFKSVIEKGGYKFALYANHEWLTKKLDNILLTGMDIWIARYNLTGHGYTGGGTVTMWQYSSTGSVNGIKGNVDMNWCYKTY